MEIMRTTMVTRTMTRMMKLTRTPYLVLLILLPLLAVLSVSILHSQIQRDRPVTSLIFRDGSNNVEYICDANAYQPTYKYQIALSNLTNIVDATNTGTVTAANHGLAVGNLVTITGATTDTDLNGTYAVQTVADANTFTITTANVTDATYTDAAMVISTNAPRNTAAVWLIRKYSYTGLYIDRMQTSRPNSICANRAVTTGATKVVYE